MDYDECDDGQVASDLPTFHVPLTTAEGAFDAAIEADGPGGAPGGGGDGEGSDMYVPDVIQKFVLFFHKQIKERNVNEIHFIYETTFNRLTDRFYKTSPWPTAEAIAPLVDEDPVFVMLYKELYYRHIYAKLQPTLDQRFESWENYGVIFDYLLSRPAAALAEAPLDLPNQWLWDILDEYVYQFQDFCRWRSRLKTKSMDEIDQLKENDQLYSAVTVLQTLEKLAEKARVVPWLEAVNAGKPEPEEVRNDPFAQSNLYRMLGCFALVGQLRVHCLLGDYRLALRCASAIDLGRRGVFTRVTACHIALCYYVGWAYLMMRRYVDATRTFSSILVYILRTKAYHSRSSQYDAIIKKNEQMYGALAVCLALCPQPGVDENVLAAMHDKFGDKVARMAKGDELAFEEVFSFGCPKFVSPCPPNYDDPAAEAGHQEAYRLQLRLFVREVRQQRLLPTVRSYLQLYTSIDVSKLASFLEVEPQVFHAHLQALKHKMHNPVWSGGPPLSGKTASASAEMNFYISGSVVHVTSTPATKRYGEYFIRHMTKFDEMAVALQKPAAKAQATTGAEAVAATAK